MISEMNRLRTLSGIRNIDVLKLTDKIGNLQIPDLNRPSSSSISNSASISTNSSLISTNSCMDSPVYSVSKRILDRFYKKTQHSDLTRNVIDRTKSSIIDIPKSICDITSKSTDFFLTLGFRFLPGQDSFITQNLRLPKTLDSLIDFKNQLGLSKLSNFGFNLSNDSLTNSIAVKASTMYSRILIDAITYHNGNYGRFLVLVQLGLRCTVWYGFHPGDALSIPVDTLLFHPIDSYDSFINQPEIHVQPGFEKITLVEKEEGNILPKLAEAYKREKPFIDVKIEEYAQGHVLMSVSLGLAIVILLSLGIFPNADLNVIPA